MLSVDSIKTSKIETIPGWFGETVEVELKRPSILALAAAGAIPNPLMKTARKLFYSGINPDGGDLAEEGRVLLEVAKAALVKPSFDELETAGDRFRQLPADPDGDIRGAEVSE